MPDLALLGGAVAALVRPAVATFARTVAGMTVLTVALAAFAIASVGTSLRGVVAALATIVLGGVLGWLLAVKRTVLVSLAGVVRESRVGARLVTSVFERIAPAGEGGGLVQRVAERVPLAAAEARLRAAVGATLAAPSKGGGFAGWVRRSIEGRLLALVEEATLVRFRSGGETGGVDLDRIRAGLVAEIDDALATKASASVRRVTWLLSGATVAGSLLATRLILELPP